MKNSNQFIEQAKQIVFEYVKEHLDATTEFEFTMNDVFVVWFSKTLNHWKALISTNIADGMYYEVTYNGLKREVYLDAYKKWENKCFTIGFEE